ncbi:4Fe-4S binding protein [Fusobacterium sp. PH5-44]|uniref:4Fe-4S binding protein n=1 Tax=unclassified Fusobacterium TaxID=2648384 RepID=UPI003D21E11D
MVKKIRLYVQVIFSIVTNGYLKGFFIGEIYKGKIKNICIPGLNCYSCPGALGSCPIGAFQGVISNRNYSLSFYIVGFFLMIGGLFGRFVCGWFCPFGLFQDLTYKIPFIKKIKKLYIDKYLNYLKYVILIIFVIILPLTILDIVGQGKPWFCTYICPSGTLYAGIPLVMAKSELYEATGILFKWKVCVLIFISLLSILIYRPFCRYLCPLGAVYGFFNSMSFIRYKIDKEKCINCNKCNEICKLNIDVTKNPNNSQCIRCGDCKDICPTKAITQIDIKK